MEELSIWTITNLVLVIRPAGFNTGDHQVSFIMWNKWALACSRVCDYSTPLKVVPDFDFAKHININFVTLNICSSYNRIHMLG